MFSKIFSKLALISFLALVSLQSFPALAQGESGTPTNPSFFQVIPPDCIQGEGRPLGLDCVIKTLVSVARIIFGISGSVALLMFVIGGFYYITSAGSDEKVKKGKEYIRNAVIGLIIILTSAYGIEYGIGTLRGVDCPGGTIYTDNATKKPACCKGVVYMPMTGENMGKEMCAEGKSEKVCKEVAPGYTCTNITARADSGANCIVGLCDGDDNNRCCPAQ